MNEIGTPAFAPPSSTPAGDARFQDVSALRAGSTYRVLHGSCDIVETMKTGDLYPTKAPGDWTILAEIRVPGEPVPEGAFVRKAQAIRVLDVADGQVTYLALPAAGARAFSNDAIVRSLRRQEGFLVPPPPTPGSGSNCGYSRMHLVARGALASICGRLAKMVERGDERAALAARELLGGLQVVRDDSPAPDDDAVVAWAESLERAACDDDEATPVLLNPATLRSGG